MKTAKSKMLWADRILRTAQDFTSWLGKVVGQFLWLLGLIPVVLDYVSTYINLRHRPDLLEDILQEGLSLRWALIMAILGLVVSAYRTHARNRSLLLASIEELEEENIFLHARLDTEEQAAKAELLIALRRWWWSIHDYEVSCAEMGSASEHEVVPDTSDIGIQLQNFGEVRIKVWMFLEPETKRLIERTQRVFLGFIARVYSVVYNHEVYGGQVPREIMRDETIARVIGSHTYAQYTFTDCQEAFTSAESFLSET